jgi:ankyrin repeat protein
MGRHTGLWLVVIVGLALAHVAHAGAREIHDAARRGDLALVRSLLAEDPTLVNVRDEDGLTPLHVACKEAQDGVVALLLDHGADANAWVDTTATPLLLACFSHPGEENREDKRSVAEHMRAVNNTVLLLLDHGADPKARDLTGQTPLHGAAMGSSQIVAALLERGAPVNAADAQRTTPLHIAANLEEPDCVRLLLQHGAFPIALDREGWTPLEIAVLRDSRRAGDPDLVKQFLESADKDKVHQAAASGDTSLLESLLEKDDVLARRRDSLGWTPLHWAVWHGQLETANLLLSAGAEVDAPDLSDLRPLDLASARGDADLVEALLTNGADIKAARPGAYTPLHWASACGRSETAKVLLAHGADVGAFDQHHRTTLHLAAYNDSVGVAEVLLSHGANPNAPDASGQTPLHLAVLNGSARMVSLLLSHGADAHRPNNHGVTPGEMARFRTEDIVKLMEHGNGGGN